MSPDDGEEHGPEPGREQAGQEKAAPVQVRDTERKGDDSAHAVDETIAPQERRAVAQELAADPRLPSQKKN
jgi:hypothetical protein